MSDNYSKDIQFLLKMLRTPAFRFVVVHYNHADPLRYLELDLRQRFPDRPFSKINAQKVQYQDISEAYAELGSGFFWIENFQDALKEERNSRGQETPEMAQENERRRHITAGLNLRRDKLAKSPIALFVLVSSAAGEGFIRTIMEKMPDLWSFRSMVLDLRVAFSKQHSLPFELNTPRVPAELLPMSTLGGANQADKAAELARLLEQLEESADEESAYRLTLYPQIISLQTDLGYYNHALEQIEAWQKIIPDNELAALWKQKGELYHTAGLLPEALDCFKQALTRYEQAGDKAQMMRCYLSIGDVFVKFGDLEQALAHFQLLRQTASRLMAEAPENGEHKNYLGLACERLGGIYTDTGRLQEALQEYEQYIRIEQELYAAFPEETRYKNNLAISYAKLGDTQSALGNLQQALTFFEKDIELTKELYEAYPQNVNFKNGLAISYSNLGQTQSDLGNLQQALTFFEQYNHLEKELYEAYPQNVSFKNGLAISYQYLGKTHSALGNLQQALTFFEQYNQLEKELYEAFPSTVEFKNSLAISYQWLGWFYEQKLQKKEANKNYLQSKILLTELVSSFPNYVAFKKNLDWVESKLTGE